MAEMSDKEYANALRQRGVVGMPTCHFFEGNASRRELLKFLAQPGVQEMLNDPDEYLHRKYYASA